MITNREVFDDLMAYVGFSEESARSLAELSPLMTPHFTEIVELFYEAVDRNPNTAAVVQDPARRARLQTSLHHWLSGVFGGVYGAEYFEQRARIGGVHVRVGLDQRYMFSAMNIVRVACHRVVLEEVVDMDFAFRAHRAIDQICDIELGIMMETYREDYVSRRTAEAASMAAMGRLTAGLAHEIRNPLNAAKLQLEVLLRNTKTIQLDENREKIARRAEIVQSELSRLSSLLNEFLDLARAPSDEAVTFDMRALLDEEAELQSPVLEARDIGFDIVLDPSVGQVVAQRNRIKQVLNNLFSNAVEALEGRSEPKITLRASTDAGWLVVEVADNGPGVSPEIRRRIFDSFVTSKDAGTGLGLTVVKKIIDNHGGTIELQSREGEGTRATFRIPLEGRASQP
ncbi:MAG: GHKL domain-containing protein [Myxococcales bacterium]|nr:GHKL domain-containing protein [Myxococcales bacterium]